MSQQTPHTVPFNQDTWATIDDTVLQAALLDVLNDSSVFRARLEPYSRDGELLGLFQHPESNLYEFSKSFSKSDIRDETHLGWSDDADRRLRR